LFLVGRRVRSESGRALSRENLWRFAKSKMPLRSAFSGRWLFAPDSGATSSLSRELL